MSLVLEKHEKDKGCPSLITIIKNKVILHALKLLLSAAIFPAFAGFFSCASVSQAASAPVRDIPADYAGVAHAGGIKTQQELLDHMGIRWILYTFNWDRIESEPGQWDFQYYDEIVDMTNEAGIKTLGILAYDSPHIHADNKRHNYIPPDKIENFQEYVRRTVEHFRGRIGAWCIWNEPNTNLFWTGSDKEFFELARLAADAVREIDSEVILMGGAFNRGVFGLQKKFIQGLFDSGAMKKCDAVAFHPYELNPSRSARLYDKFKKMIDPYGFGNKIWITEIGYPTSGWYPTKVPEEKLYAHVIKTFTLLAVRGSQKLLWYQLFDPVDRKPSNSEDFFGLVRSREDFTSKGADAFRLCATFISGTSLSTQELQREKLPASLAAYYFRGNETNALVMWNNNPAAIKVSAALPGTSHTRHDPVTGATESIQANVEMRIDSAPVFITWEGGGEQAVVLKKR